MPLSDNEQRLLEQMERALSAEDPKFASAMRGAGARFGTGQRVVLGALAVLLGLVLLVVGVAQHNNVTQTVLLGVMGFVLMLVGTTYAVSAHRKPGPTGIVTGSGEVRRPRRRSRRGTFMQRLEQRWERRRGER